MTVGEKFADALAGYTSGTDNKLFPSMLHDDFHWESWAEIKIGLQVETKETTLELFSNATPHETSKVFLLPMIFSSLGIEQKHTAQYYLPTNFRTVSQSGHLAEGA